MAWWAVLLLLPYLLTTWIGWHAIRRLSREACCDEVAPGVWVGRRPLPGDLPPGRGEATSPLLIVDLTAEFPSGLRRAARPDLSVRADPGRDGAGGSRPARGRGDGGGVGGDGLHPLRARPRPIRDDGGGGADPRGLAADPVEAVVMMQQARPRIRLEKSQERLLERMAVQVAAVGVG